MMTIFYAECEPTIGVEKNYLLVKCALCTKDMILTEGSVIFGSKWYHVNCFDNIRSKLIFANESKIHDIENIGAN